jgi:acyl-CoA thioester hydrolase
LNYGNHLSNDRLLTFAHQARVEWLASLGFSELDFGGVGIIMTDAAVVYKAEGHLNDELLIELGIEDLTKMSFDLYYKVSRPKDAKILALVKTGILGFDYRNKKVAAFSTEILQLLAV